MAYLEHLALSTKYRQSYVYGFSKTSASQIKARDKLFQILKCVGSVSFGWLKSPKSKKFA